MCLADERILERLDEFGTGTAWEIAFDLDRRVRHVRRRCRVLADADFVGVVRSILLDYSCGEEQCHDLCGPMSSTLPTTPVSARVGRSSADSRRSKTKESSARFRSIVTAPADDRTDSSRVGVSLGNYLRPSSTHSRSRGSRSVPVQRDNRWEFAVHPDRQREADDRNRDDPRHCHPEATHPPPDEHEVHRADRE